MTLSKIRAPRTALALLLGGLALAGCTATAGGTGSSGSGAARAAAETLAPVGAPVDCLQLTSIRNTRVLDDSTIDFIMNNGDVYRNTLPQSCPSLGFEQRFSYKTSLSQLCSVDIITVLYNAGGIRPGASCGLGKFQKMAKTTP